MVTASINKGNALEESVRAIEHAILASSPGMEKDSFRIENKKITVVDGVRNEIDVWVEIDHGKGYRSVFIFECKNWENSVGKNEIIIFSEKMDVFTAQKGFFVAKSFTKDAIAQSKKDKRITLLNASESPIKNIPVPFGFHFIVRENEYADFLITERNYSKTVYNTKRNVEIKNAKCLLSEEIIDLEKYLQEWVKECSEKRTNTFPSATLEEGVYDLQAKDCRAYNNNELYINDKEIEKIEIDVNFKVRLYRPAIESHYEVESRGRVLYLSPVQLEGGGYMKAGFVSNEK